MGGAPERPGKDPQRDNLRRIARDKNDGRQEFAVMGLLIMQAREDLANIQKGESALLFVKSDIEAMIGLTPTGGMALYRISAQAWGDGGNAIFYQSDTELEISLIEELLSGAEGLLPILFGGVANNQITSQINP